MADEVFTLEEAKNALVEAMSARSKIMNGAKTVKISTGGNERSVTREDLNVINDDILMWETRVRRLQQGGGIQARGVAFAF